MIVRDLWKKTFLFFLCFSLSCTSLRGAPQLPLPLKVVATFTIIADMVKTIGGPHVEVQTIVGPNGDAHVHEPLPDDLKKILESDVLFVNGLGFEGWLTRLIKASGYKGPIIVATEGIPPLLTTSENKLPDPHAWNSISLAFFYVQNIVNALKQYRPEHGAYFEKAAHAYRLKLEKLRLWALDKLREIPKERRKIITTHDAFRYFGQEFEISFISLMGVDTNAETSASMLVQVAQKIKQQNIQALFFENIKNPNMMKVLAEETKVRIGGTLYSDALSEPFGPAPTYYDLMKHNISQILSVLTGREVVFNNEE